MSLSLTAKGLVLLAVPLVFQLAFAGLVFRMQRASADAQRQAAHTKVVVSQAHEVLANLSDAQSGVRGYVITRNPNFLRPFERAGQELPGNLARLVDLTLDNPGQTARAADIARKATGFMAVLGAVADHVRAGAVDRAAGRVRAGEGNRLMDDLRAEVGGFLAEEERLDRERTAALARTQDVLTGVLVAGGLGAVLTAGTLAYFFRRGIVRRFAVLMDNTGRLAAGRELAPPPGGGDEIARLDRAFRDTAAELARTADRLRGAVREVRDLYENAPCGYHSVDPDGTVVAMNLTELRWLGYGADEVVGRMRFADVLAPASRDAYRAAFARLKAEGEVGNVELELVRRDGTTFPVLAGSSAARDEDGRYRTSRTTLVDLTERKRAEDAVRRLNAELEGRVRERTAELAEANRDLAQKNAENEMFVYSVSHDLRNPLVNLQGFSKELGKAAKTLAGHLTDAAVPPAVRGPAAAVLDGKMAKSIGFIQAAVLRLSGIIDALLRLSRAGRVEYRWEQVDVGRVVGRVVDALNGTIAERQARVTVGDLPPARGDATALEQAFANLIGNALAYLDPTRPGEIEVGCLAAGGDAARTYFVRDNGLGIADGHRARIFQPFQRAHPGVGTGEGLGLAIVARVAERHRGRVWVESRAGEGSTFFVALPADPTGEGEP